MGLPVYPPIFGTQRLGKHVPAATKNCWRRRFLCGPCRIKESRRLVFPRTPCFRVKFHVSTITSYKQCCISSSHIITSYYFPPSQVSQFRFQKGENVWNLFNLFNFFWKIIMVLITRDLNKPVSRNKLYNHLWH
jgi:hypothetical protein